MGPCTTSIEVTPALTAYDNAIVESIWARFDPDHSRIAPVRTSEDALTLIAYVDGRCVAAAVVRVGCDPVAIERLAHVPAVDVPTIEAAIRVAAADLGAGPPA